MVLLAAEEPLPADELLAWNPDPVPAVAVELVVSGRNGILQLLLFFSAHLRYSPEVICMSRAICCRSDMGVFWTPLPDRDDWPGIFVILFLSRMIRVTALNFRFPHNTPVVQRVGLRIELQAGSLEGY